MKQTFSEFMIQARMIALQRHMSKQDLTSLELKSQIMWILSFLCVVVSVWFAYSKSKIYIYAVWAYLCLSDNFTSSKKLSHKSRWLKSSAEQFTLFWMMSLSKAFVPMKSFFNAVYLRDFLSLWMSFISKCYIK